MSGRLAGKSIVVTRPVGSAESFISALLELEAEVFHVPSIEIVGPDSWRACDKALANLQTFDWLIFTSANAVRFFLSRANRNEIHVANFNGKIAAVGERTARALKTHGLQADLIPKLFSSEGLISSFENIMVTDKRILVPGPEKRNDSLASQLGQMGAFVEVVAVYKNRPAAEKANRQIAELKKRTNPDICTFTSPSTFSGFVSMVGEAKFVSWLASGTKVGVIGGVTKAAVINAGYKVHIVPREATLDSLVKAILDYFND